MASEKVDDSVRTSALPIVSRETNRGSCLRKKVRQEGGNQESSEEGGKKNFQEVCQKGGEESGEKGRFQGSNSRRDWSGRLSLIPEAGGNRCAEKRRRGLVGSRAVALEVSHCCPFKFESIGAGL